MLFIMVLLVWRYTTTCAGVGKTVAGEGRTRLGHLYQLNQSTVSAGVWTTPFYAFIMRLTMEERVFISKSYLKTMSYAHCRQSFFEKFRRPAPVKSAIANMIKKWKNAKKKLRGTWWNVSISALDWMYIISNTHCKYRLVV